MCHREWASEYFSRMLLSFYFSDINVFFGKEHRVIPRKTIFWKSDLITTLSFQIMKIKDLQKPVHLKYKNDDGATKIFRVVNSVLSLSTIERWHQMFCESDSVNSLKLSVRSQTIWIKEIIEKNKFRVNRVGRISVRKTLDESAIS